MAGSDRVADGQLGAQLAETLQLAPALSVRLDVKRGHRAVRRGGRQVARPGLLERRGEDVLRCGRHPLHDPCPARAVVPKDVESIWLAHHVTCCEPLRLSYARTSRLVAISDSTGLDLPSSGTYTRLLMRTRLHYEARYLDQRRRRYRR